MSSCSYRVLYVDDNSDSCELVAVMFSHSDTGCVVTSAESAEKALQLIETESFDAYIFDYKLPDISGVELCRRIRQYDAQTPILFFSGMANSNDAAEARAAGANDYLVKPNDLPRLTETVKQFLEENSRKRLDNQDDQLNDCSSAYMCI